MMEQSLDQTASVDGQVYNVHCAASSDFVVGRQTNFHAPVTIYNCPSPIPGEPPENIVISDQLWTHDVNKALEFDAAARTNGTSKTRAERPIEQKSTDLTFKKLLVRKSFFGVPSFIWLIIVFALLSCLIVGVIELSIVAGSSPVSGEVKDNSTLGGDEKIWIGDKSHLFFPKAQWGGLNASSKIVIQEPTQYVIITHSAGNFCYDTVTCQQVIRNIQKDLMSRTPPFADIAFNFLVGGDGYIYEGRGWGVRSPHEGFTGNRNIDINFIGDFSVYDVPTDTQVDAVKKLIERGVQDCHLASDYILIAHNATMPTLSPGKNVYKIISQWDHFQANPIKTQPKRAGMDPACPNSKPKPPYFLFKEKTETVTSNSTSS